MLTPQELASIINEGSCKDVVYIPPTLTMSVTKWSCIC